MFQISACSTRCGTASFLRRKRILYKNDRFRYDTAMQPQTKRDDVAMTRMRYWLYSAWSDAALMRLWEVIGEILVERGLVERPSKK